MANALYYGDKLDVLRSEIASDSVDFPNEVAEPNMASGRRCPQARSARRGLPNQR
jgi:hypothetical protein